MKRHAYQLSINLQVTETQERLHVGVFKADKSEPFASPSFAVQHHGRVHDGAVLREEFPHRFRGDGAGKTADKEFGGPLVLLTRNCALGIDLDNHQLSATNQLGSSTYDFAIQEVLSNHNGVDAGRLFEGQESEATGTACGVSHNGACINFSKLLKVLAERFYESKALSTIE